MAHLTTGSVSGRACPLCGNRRHRTLRTIRYQDIFEELERQWLASFDPGTRNRYAPTETTELRRCHSCGLEYFEPAIAADGEFYARLVAPIGYDRKRWEFGEVLACLTPNDAVVDFGAGEGDFLKLAQPMVRRTVAVDYNPEGVDKMRKAGIEAYADDFGEFASSHRDHFDVACAFQVLEHVLDPVGLLAAICKVVKPSGRVFISMPNRDRYFRDSRLEPLDCPPHHLTRWGSDQLAVLAIEAGVHLTSSFTEPLDHSQAAAWMEERLISRIPSLGRHHGRPARLIRKLYLSSPRYEAMVRSGFFERRGLVGHTMLAELSRLPSAHAGPSRHSAEQLGEGLDFG